MINTDEHPLNAPKPIVFNDKGKVGMDINDEQPENALFPILVNAVDHVGIRNNAVHPENALSGMTVIGEDMYNTFVIAVLLVN